MSNDRLLLCQQSIDGRQDVTMWGAAALFGTTTAELGKWVDFNGDPVAAEKLPDRLIQRGRRRGRDTSRRRRQLCDRDVDSLGHP